jgi:hypothetical protein
MRGLEAKEVSLEEVFAKLTTVEQGVEAEGASPSPGPSGPGEEARP